MTNVSVYDSRATRNVKKLMVALAEVKYSSLRELRFALQKRVPLSEVHLCFYTFRGDA